MRLLHPGPDHVGSRLHPRGPCRIRRRDPRIHVGQSLSLRRVSEHRRRGSPSRGGPDWGGRPMRNFSYLRAGSVDEARRAAAQSGAMLLAGGTTLLDLAKCGVAEPDTVVDITHLRDLDSIAHDADGVSIGALAKMSAVAADG